MIVRRRRAKEVEDSHDSVELTLRLRVSDRVRRDEPQPHRWTDASNRRILEQPRVCRADPLSREIRLTCRDPAGRAFVESEQTRTRNTRRTNIGRPEICDAHGIVDVPREDRVAETIEILAPIQIAVYQNAFRMIARERVEIRQEIRIRPDRDDHSPNHQRADNDRIDARRRRANDIRESLRAGDRQEWIDRKHQSNAEVDLYRQADREDDER